MPGTRVFCFFLQFGCKIISVPLPEIKRKVMKQYVKEIVSFILLVSGIGMTWGNAVWFGEGHVRAMWYAVAFLPVGLPVLRELLAACGNGSILTSLC